MSHHKSSLRKSLKRSKPSSNTKGDALLFIITRTTSQLKIIIKVEDNKDNSTSLKLYIKFNSATY
jgi:hypothetical protein